MVTVVTMGGYYGYYGWLLWVVIMGGYYGYSVGSRDHDE